MRLKPAEQAIPLEDVEPAAEIVKRFATGAMSFGSISREAHTTLAMAMNRIGRPLEHRGGRRGGRPFSCACPTAIPCARRSSRWPRAASGSPPSTWSTPTTSRSRWPRAPSPGRAASFRSQGRQEHRPRPPFDPRRRPDQPAAAPRHLFDRGPGPAHPRPEERQPGRPHLREAGLGSGVGTVAAGVAKARADHLTISGFEGGTGASPLTSLTHAGSPWEIGLAETQQTLLLNGLRTRVAVQADGGLRTGRDVAVAALLGADEFGFATAPLIAAGCIMMRKCHLNTCPVGGSHPGPGAARALHRPARARDQLLLLRRRRAAGDHGRDGLCDGQRDDRPRRPPRHGPGAGPLEGPGRRSLADPLCGPRRGRQGLVEPGPPGPRPGQGAGQHPDRRRRGRARKRQAGARRISGAQRQPHGRRDAIRRGGPQVRPCGPAGRHHFAHLPRQRRPELRRLRLARGVA